MIDWKDMYLKLRNYYNSVWIAYRIYLEFPTEFTKPLGVYKRKTDAIENTAELFWGDFDGNEDIYTNESGEQEFEPRDVNSIYNIDYVSGSPVENFLAGNFTFKRLLRELDTHRTIVVYGMMYQIRHVKVE